MAAVLRSSAYLKQKPIRVLDPVPCFDLLNLGLRRLPNKLLSHPRFTADQIQEALDCRISRKRRDHDFGRDRFVRETLRNDQLPR